MLARCSALVLLVAVLLAAPAASQAEPASATSMALQPDGKIVIAGRDWLPFATLARLEPDGALDQGFGQNGFVLDRRLQILRSLAIQPGGDIVGAGVEGFQLARYLGSNGAPDPAFGGGLAAGTRDPKQPNFLYQDYGPSSVVPDPGGGIVVGGTQKLGRSEAPTAIVRRYASDGTFLETIGSVPQPKGFTDFESHLATLLPQPDGSLIGAGWVHQGFQERGDSILLARFRPGSGMSYDPSFGGMGLVTVKPPAAPVPDTRTTVNDAAQDGTGVVVAGEANGTFLLARFNQDGALDPAFGEGGLSIPPIDGLGGPLYVGAFVDPGSWANAVARTPTGGFVAVGGTARWGRWQPGGRDLAPSCGECPQPMLVGLGTDGKLDPHFGAGGLLRLRDPGGSVLDDGEAESVIPLADGKLLVKGTYKVAADGAVDTFVARLEPDGTYDQSFGADGLVSLRFPCYERARANLECSPTVAAKLVTGGLRTRRPRFSLRLGSRLPWAQIGSVRISLPTRVRVTQRLAARSKATAQLGGKWVAAPSIKANKRGEVIFFGDRRNPQAVRVTLASGALRFTGKRRPGEKLRFNVRIYFTHEGRSAGDQTLNRVRAG